MSSGRLVVLRGGRDVKHLALGLPVVRLGRHPDCDVRITLPQVRDHHATIAILANRAVLRNETDGATLLNGRSVSLEALCHNDIINIGGRCLRWEYSAPSARRPLAAPPGLVLPRGAARAGPRRSRAGTRRASGGANSLRLPLEMHRASLPAKQIAIVQPQRREALQPTASTSRASNTARQAQKRTRNSDNESQVLNQSSESESDRTTRKSTPRVSPKSLALQNTTKATLWIESRKLAPRKAVQTPPPVVKTRKSVSSKKATPLRLTVLRKAQNAQKVMKIEEPSTIDYTKQAAIMLMTGHTPKGKLPGGRGASWPRRAPRGSSGYLQSRGSSLASPRIRTLIQASSDFRNLSQISPGLRNSSRASPALRNLSPTSPGLRNSSRSSPSLRNSIQVSPSLSNLSQASPGPRAPSQASTQSSRASKRSSARQSPSVLEITDSDSQNSTIRQSSARRSKTASLGSPQLPSPKKSSLKDPSVKRSMRKTESIKFDLSNLQNAVDRSDEDVTEDDTEANLTLHYSDSSSTKSPSPRRPIHSRGSRMLESIGSPMSERRSSKRTLTPESPRTAKLLRGGALLQKALDTSGNNTSYSRRTTKTADGSWDTTVASGFATRTLSPRAATRNLESYSIVDLVSVDSNNTAGSTSLYDSVGSTCSSSIMFGTPQSRRTTRSTIGPNLLGTSTPYVGVTRSNSSPNSSRSSPKSVTSRRSKSASTPENSQKHFSVNSTRVSRTSRSKSRINDSDLQFISSRLDATHESPESFRRASRADKSNNISVKSSPLNNRNSSRRNITLNVTTANSPRNKGIVTPENGHSPVEVGTPVLSIQSLLDSSQSSFASQPEKKRVSVNVKRKTMGAIRSGRKGRNSLKSKSLNMPTRKSLRSLRLSKDSSADSDKTDENAPQPDNQDTITPTSAVKLVPEAVKNKHSTAKKPHSKRSLIDNLDGSDFVKQLFNSPVKRKLSRSMTEFSRKNLYDDDEIVPRRPTRNTTALTGQMSDYMQLDNSERFTPENFVSPLTTPSNSPNLSGIKRMFQKNTPENDLRNVSGVKAVITRRSIRNDLTKVSGLKAVFARSPKNRLSDVRVKELFAAGPRNDLRRVTGVKDLFQAQSALKNDLSDVRGVKSLFTRRSAANDLRNVSGVKRTMHQRSPKNDLSDVRGVRRLFKQQKKQDDFNVSGVEALFNESDSSPAEPLFDKLVGRPTVKAVYSKSVITKRGKKQSKSRKTRSLHLSAVPMDNVEEWLEQELQKRIHKDDASTSKSSKSLNKSNASNTRINRELQKLATDTVEGSTPIRGSRVRDSAVMRLDETKRQKSAAELYSARKLPIKKRSLVDCSSENTHNKSKPIQNLPIKKRGILVASTPVKQTHNSPMNASEFHRMSPVAADKTSLENHSGSRLRTKSTPKAVVVVVTEAQPRGRRTALNIDESKKTIAVESPKQRGRRGAKKVTEVVKVSPKPRGRKSAKVTNIEDIKSATEPKTTNTSSKNEDIPQATTRSRKNKNVKQKESPVKTSKKDIPKGTTPKEKENRQLARVVTVRVHALTPKTLSVARGQATSPIKNKKSSRNNTTVNNKSKKSRPSLVIPKKSPVLSPKPSPKKTRAARVVAITTIQTQNTRRRKNNTVANNTNDQDSLVVVTKSPMKSFKAARSTRRNQKVSTVESPKTANTLAHKSIKIPTSTRARSTKATVIVSKPSPKLKPKGNVKSGTAAKSRSTRGKAGKKIESPKKSPPAKRGRKAVENSEVDLVLQTKRVLGAKAAQSDKKTKKTPAKNSPLQKQGSKPTRADRRVKNEVTPESPKGRKRQAKKSPLQIEKSKPTRANHRGKNEVTVMPESPKGRKRKAPVEKTVVSPKKTKVEAKTRGRQKQTETANDPEAKPARGRKAAGASPDGRKRKPKASPSPVKGPSKRARNAAPAPPARAPSRRRR